MSASRSSSLLSNPAPKAGPGEPGRDKPCGVGANPDDLDMVIDDSSRSHETRWDRNAGPLVQGLHQEERVYSWNL